MYPGVIYTAFLTSVNNNSFLRMEKLLEIFQELSVLYQH